MTHDAITCKRLILEYLVDYEDGAMPEEVRRDLEWHLEHSLARLIAQLLPAIWLLALWGRAPGQAIESNATRSSETRA